MIIVKSEKMSGISDFKVPFKSLSVLWSVSVYFVS